MSIRDPTGANIGRGSPGELCVRSDLSTTGYLDKDGEAADCTDDDG